MSLKGFINTKLHNTISKCLETKNPTNVGVSFKNHKY